VGSQRIPAVVSGLAPTSSAPNLTFEGHLVQFIEQGLPSDVKSAGPPGMGKPSAEMVAQDKGLNPSGKVLNTEQYRSLLRIQMQYREQEADLTREDRGLTRAALVLAVTRGQFVATENQRCTATSPEEMAIEWRASSERARRVRKETMQDLTNRLGKPLRDWAYTSCSTYEPDGIPRSTIVYFTHADAPEVFACRERIVSLWRQEREELRQFFASLP
jgi:hypothetical protein